MSGAVMKRLFNLSRRDGKRPIEVCNCPDSTDLREEVIVIDGEQWDVLSVYRDGRRHSSFTGAGRIGAPASIKWNAP